MVIPLGDHNPTRIRPWVNWALIAINLGVFLLAQPWAQDQCAQHQFFVSNAVIPAEVMSGQPLDDFTAAALSAPGCPVRNTPDKPVYRAALYSMFFHAGWLHLLGNLLYLWIFGNNIEDRFGHARYLLFYLTAGVVATAAFVLPNPHMITTLVGASGAIAGVLGAYLVMFPRARVTVAVPFLLFFVVRLPAFLVLGSWFLFQLRYASDPLSQGDGVAYLAHIGGFAFGLLVGFVFKLAGRRPTSPRHPKVPPIAF